MRLSNRFLQIIAFVFSLFLFLDSDKALAQWNYFRYHSDYHNQYTTSTSFIDAEYFNIDTGFYSRSYYYSPSSGGGYVTLRSTQIGGSWNSVYSGSGQGVSVYPFFTAKPQKTLYLLTSYMGSASFKKTSNFGATWTSVGMYIPVFHSDIHIPDTSHIYCLYDRTLSSYENRIYNSSKHVFQGVTPIKIYFTDSLTGFVAARDSNSNNSHIIQKTVNGGINWNSVFTDVTCDIRKIFFDKLNNGYAACKGGIVLKSVDGGNSWFRTTNASTLDLTSIWFLNDSLGFVSGVSGLIARTQDGGQTWTRDSISTTNTIRKVYFINDSIGFALAPSTFSGAYTYQINLNSPSPVWVEKKENKTEIQVFPNPCSDALTILLHEILLDKKVDISLSSLDGRTIKNEELISSGNPYILDLMDLPRGMYALRISSDNYIKSFRVILQ